jgi:Lon protease-like protein
MEMEITLPAEVPVMTLPNVAFFPQALMPLHIFEPRYRRMLRDVLASNRLFAVAGIDPRVNDPEDALEPIHRIASVGIVRACQKRDNGTSDLLLQGLVRVEVLEVVTEKPYRSIRIRALASAPGAEAAENERLRQELARLLQLKSKLGARAPLDVAAFVQTIDDPEVFSDLAAFTFCENPAVKQKLLETLDVNRRLQLFSRQLKAEIASLRLRRKLQGDLEDGDISNN